MFNGFKRQRGSWSAMQATIAYTNSQECFPGDIEVACQSIDSLGDVRILNDPTRELADNSDENGLCANEEITSNELAILSTSSSASISLSLDQAAEGEPEVYPISSSNSQKIDEWCMKNDVTCNTVFAGDGLIWKKDVGDNFTYPILSRLSKSQILAVREFSRELIPFLRRTRQSVQNKNKFPHRYGDIPSVFYVRPPSPNELYRCSQDKSIFGSESWLDWTVVHGFTEPHVRPY